MQKIKGYLEIKEGEIEGIASTESADRDGEIIRQDGWDLKNFKKNPVLLASHNYHEFPIGKITNIKIDEKQLTFKAVFSQVTQKAIEAYQLVQEGILKAFSVGFIPRKFDEKNQNIITEAELLEISLVSVPANPQAIVTAKTMKENKTAQELIKIWLLDESMKKQVDEIEKPKEKEKKEDIKTTTEVVGENDKTNGEDSGKVDAKELDKRLLQKTVGHLQTLLAELNRKGGAKT